MLSADAFQRIANALPWIGRRHGSPLCYELRPAMKGWNELTLSEAIVRDWYVANRLAVQGRYEGRHGTDEIEPQLPDTFRCQLTTGKMSPVALYKMLQCLRYQCSEDVAPGAKEQHEEWLDEIDRAIDSIGSSIIAAMPEYEAAEWG